MGQLLAELLCPWLLGFCPAPSTHNGTLSCTAANVHTCFYICGHMHTQRHTRGPYVQDTCAGARTHRTHPNTRTPEYKLGGYVLQHLFTMGYPSCPADVILRTCTHIHNNNCLLYTNMVYIKNMLL